MVNKKLYYEDLKKYTLQQYKNGKPFIAEFFAPDSNIWACDIDERSEHYLHSSYINVIVSGFVGIRSSEADMVTVNSQIPETWDHFCLEDLPHHGKRITVFYDDRMTGNRYKVDGINEIDNGLSVYLDGIGQGYSPNLPKLTIEMKSSNKPGPECKVNFSSTVYEI
ncbi:MAG: hypothetical protein ACI9YE_001348 [Psychroserpens sp.]|jgi:hypothetical protein